MKLAFGQSHRAFTVKTRLPALSVRCAPQNLIEDKNLAFKLPHYLLHYISGEMALSKG